MRMEWVAEIFPTLLANGWSVTILFGLGLVYFMATDRLATRGRLRAMEKDRDYWRKAAELERERSDRAQATVNRMLPAAENAVRVVEAFTQVTSGSDPAALERGDARR
jgi:hypothetical protein